MKLIKITNIETERCGFPFYLWVNHKLVWYREFAGAGGDLKWVLGLWQPSGTEWLSPGVS